MLVAAGIQPGGQCQQRFLLHLQHPPVGGPGGGRERDIHQHQHGEVALLRPGGAVDPVAARGAGAAVGKAAHQGGEVELLTVRLRVQDLAARPPRTAGGPCGCGGAPPRRASVLA
jgi:hypothetical protein